MTTPVFIGLGLLLAVILFGLLAWRKARDAANTEAWQRAYEDKLVKAEAVQLAARCRDNFRIAELKTDIAKAKSQKKRHSHMQAELQALMNRRLLWERGA